MNTIKECFKIILTGEREASRLAARGVRKLIYRSQSGKDDYEDIKKRINNAPGEHAKIFEDWRQENFVMAISVMYFLHNREGHPDFLFPWLFQLLQHENGNIRHAAVRMIEHELGPFTYHVRFPNRKSDPFHMLSSEQADQILCGLHSNLEALAANSYKPSYKKYKYIDSLPSGTYKSVQHILSRLDDYCTDTHESKEIETIGQIIERREEIEQKLAELLKKIGSDFVVQDIKDIIYNEESKEDFNALVIEFSKNQDLDELNKDLQIVSMAWNYFPHKVLGGISPAEKLLEYYKNSHK